jgi:AhpD family alkylhydroperoxidase
MEVLMSDIVQSPADTDRRDGDPFRILHLRDAARLDAMSHLSSTTRQGLEPLLLELVKIRASQINGCAYCLDMHTKDARALGETNERLDGLAAWSELPWYSERERAALELTEAVTRLSEGHPSQDVLDRVGQHFTPDEASALLYAAVTINAWNRLGVIGTPSRPGSYRPSGG